MNEIIESLRYVVSGNMFWGSMGFTTAIGMFIGASVHNGDLKSIKKGVITTMCYAMLASWTHLLRVFPNIIDGKIYQKTYAGSITLMCVAIFYILGICLGVLLIRKIKKSEAV